MSQGIRFTIITSTLNSATTLERCLRSVAGQSHDSFEHLIADGASRDDTLAIVERYQSSYPLRLVCSRLDTGLYQAWNRGVDQARGEWILFLGSDDFFVSNDVLDHVANELRCNSILGAKQFIYGDTVSTDEPDWPNYNPSYWMQWLRGVTEFPASVFINARLFDHGWRFDESYRICADHKFFAEHCLFASSAYLPIPIISFQRGGISTSASFQRVHYLERRRMLRELHRSRPLLTEAYYWLRSFR
jgi:glycosyltransferase involved in cell wall biosynthesis